MTPDQAAELAALHARACWASRNFVTATPGTLTSRRREGIWDRAEKRFQDYLQSLLIGDQS